MDHEINSDWCAGRLFLEKITPNHNNQSCPAFNSCSASTQDCFINLLKILSAFASQIFFSVEAYTFHLEYSCVVKCNATYKGQIIYFILLN
jgi:hypothetical protein